MQMKDITRYIGSVGIFIPLILIFLTTADSAFGCPGQNSGVAYRIRTTNNRTVSAMPATVITYRAPVSYKRCGDNMFDTRGRRYVAVRSSNGYHSGSGAKFVAVRSGDRYYKQRQAGYIAVRDARTEESPRYIAIRHKYPIYRIDDNRYAEIRSGYRHDNGIVRYIDMSEQPRYAAVRRPSSIRYVAVANDRDYYDEARTRYVAIRNSSNGCTRAIRSCLDPIETTSMKRVVLRDGDNDDNNIVLRSESERGLDSRYVADNGRDYDTTIVENDNDDDEAYLSKHDDDDDVHIAMNDRDDVSYVAVRESPRYVEFRDAAYSTGPATSYVSVSNNNDFDNDQAILDDGGATYVAADDVEDACLRQSSMRTAGYVPVEAVDDEIYMAADHVPRSISYVPIADDVEYTDAEDASYIPVEQVEDTDIETVRYVPVEAVDYVPATSVRYVAVEDNDLDDVSYAAADDCPMAMSRVETAPMYVADESAVLIDGNEGELVAGLSGERIASEYGLKDGFEDGREAALECDVYHPENSGDYQKATEGYEDSFGDKDVYKGSYRDSYLRGYRSGFDSLNGSA